MCAVCVNCGKCEGKPRPGLKPGACPICGFENDPDASTCAQCHCPLPKPPGTPVKPVNGD